MIRKPVIQVSLRAWFMLQSMCLANAAGIPVSTAAPKGGAAAIVFYSTECPISNEYSPTLNALARANAGKLNMVGICVDHDLDEAAVAKHAAEFQLAFPVILDKTGALSARYGAKVTPEVVVLDDAGRTRYQGRIDDQYYERGKRNLNPTEPDLERAIAAVLAGKPIDRERTVAVGCPIPSFPKTAETPTYAREIAAILQRNCLDCHRKGQVAPFSLETYEQARKRAGDLATVVSDRRMPPWKPSPGVGRVLQHDKSLSRVEIDAIVAWADAGAPLGDVSELPVAPIRSADWALGTPDLVLEADADFEVPAGGDDVYRCFVIPNKLLEDKYIAAIEYRPGNRKVVHHILSYVDVSGEGRKRDAADAGPGYACFSGPGVPVHGDLGGWAPGNEPAFLPEGVGRSLPKGADVVMQVHYHPSGKPERDRSRMGLYFSRKPVKQTLHWGFAANFEMKLPAGDANREVTAEWETPVDLVAHAATPHMHMLGRDMEMYLTFPDGRRENLVKIGDWDFGWQNTYWFDRPVDLPKGTKLRIIAHYDNSDKNPRNPNKPPKPVAWGEATTDEMCIGFLGVVKKGQDLTKPGERDDLGEILFPSEDERDEKSKAKQASP